MPSSIVINAMLPLSKLIRLNAAASSSSPTMPAAVGISAGVGMAGLDDDRPGGCELVWLRCAVGMAARGRCAEWVLGEPGAVA